MIGKAAAGGMFGDAPQAGRRDQHTPAALSGQPIFAGGTSATSSPPVAERNKRNRAQRTAASDGRIWLRRSAEERRHAV